MTDKAVKIEGRQQALKSDWSTNIEKLESAVLERIQEQTAAITSMHQERLDHVQQLVAKKTDIERRIATTTMELRDAYMQTKNIFEVILAGRLADCEKGLKMLDAVSNGQSGE